MRRSVPDDNKFEKLREVGYHIPKLCMYCTNSNLSGSWGTCDLHRYEHKKHENPEGGRGISIHVSGSCKQGFEPDTAQLDKLGAHLEFFNGNS